MIKTIGFILSFAIIFASCTTKHKGTSTTAQTVPTYERAPSSLEDFEVVTDATTTKDLRSLNVAFASAQLVLFEKAKADVKRRMNQILKRSAAAAALMNDFDRKLDTYFDSNGNLLPGTNFNLQGEQIYTKLQNTRELVELVEARMITVYAHLWKLYLYPERAGISKARAARVKERAKQMLEYVHSEVNSYMSDIRVVGMIRMSHHIDELAAALSSDIRTADPVYTELQNIVAKIQVNENDISTLSYDDFIDVMKNFRDLEYEKEMRDRENSRTPQSNILVTGFKNETGSTFGANKWVLTFDDGPHKTQTQIIAAALKAQGAKGDFFWLSKLVKTYPSIAKEIYDGGYGIASHSVDHSNLPKLSVAEIKKQVSGSRDTIEEQLHNKGASSYKMKDFRCPYGACWAPKSKNVQQAMVDAGLRHVYWTVDTMDWQDKNTQSVLARTLKQMKAAGKGVILFHDIHPVAGNVLPLLFKDKYVQDNKLEFLSL